MSENTRPLPDLEHPLYGPFWTAVAEGRLSMQQCGGCGYVRWPPEPLCPECLMEGGTWVDLSGRGSIWSFAVYEHAFHESLRAEVPYICALVELDEGPRLISRLVGVEQDQAQVGMRVSATFGEIAPGARLVCFEPHQGAG